MQNPNVPTSPILRFFLKSLPTTVIAGMAFIAIQHPPSTETNRMILSTIVAISICLNGWYGPVMSYKNRIALIAENASRWNRCEFVILPSVTMKISGLFWFNDAAKAARTCKLIACSNQQFIVQCQNNEQSDAPKSRTARFWNGYFFGRDIGDRERSSWRVSCMSLRAHIARRE